jgi:hypothetical protein
MEINYDILIVSHQKDFNKIKFIVENCEKNLKFNNYYLILNNKNEFKDLEKIKLLTNKNINIFDEKEVFKLDFTKIKHRPNWIYQMMLKFFQNVTELDNYLIIESDTIINTSLDFFKDNKTIFYLGNNQHHQPYFNFNKNVIGIDKKINYSFISEIMMYDKKNINKLLEYVNCKNKEEFFDIIYKTVNENSYPADYELYGNFCLTVNPENFIFKNIKVSLNGKELKNEGNYTDEEINNLIENNKTFDVISFHTWI